MDARILNTNFETVAVIDSFESFIWTDRYDRCGDFEIYMSMEQSLLKYIVKDYYLWIKDSEHQMIIETLHITSDIEEGNKLVVTGRSLESLLERRIVWGQKTLSGNLQNGIENLLNENIINPSDSNRKIDNFVFVPSENPKITELTVNAQYTGDTLYEIISTLCQKNKIGFKIILTEDNTFEFSLYAGKDRTYDQSENPYVIFSPHFENIINSNYLETTTTYRNITLVAGEGEGNGRVMLTVGNGGVGIYRRELFTDAGDISSDTDNGGSLSAGQYQALLRQRGEEMLVEYCESVSFEGEVEATRMFKYGNDFFIGDIVQIANEYGHEGKAYISEFIMSTDTKGVSMYPTFETIQEGEENNE